MNLATEKLRQWERQRENARMPTIKKKKKNEQASGINRVEPFQQYNWDNVNVRPGSLHSHCDFPFSWNRSGINTTTSAGELYSFPPPGVSHSSRAEFHQVHFNKFTPQHTQLRAKCPLIQYMCSVYKSNSYCFTVGTRSVASVLRMLPVDVLMTKCSTLPSGWQTLLQRTSTKLCWSRSA